MLVSIYFGKLLVLGSAVVSISWIFPLSVSFVVLAKAFGQEGGWRKIFQFPSLLQFPSETLKCKVSSISSWRPSAPSDCSSCKEERTSGTALFYTSKFKLNANYPPHKTRLNRFNTVPPVVKLMLWFHISHMNVFFMHAASEGLQSLISQTRPRLHWGAAH